MKLLFFAAFDVAFTVRFNAQTGFDSTACRAQDVLYAEGAPEGFVNPLVDFGSHHLLEMLDVGVDASALQTCYNLHREQGEWKLGWKKKMIDAMIQFGQTTMDSKARDLLVQPLLANILDWQQPGAKKLVTWALEHEDGRNPFCTNIETMDPQERMDLRKEIRELFEHFGDLLVSGHAEHTSLQLDPGSSQVNTTLSFLIKKAIAATFVADCNIKSASQVSHNKQLSWDTSINWPPVVLQSFELLKKATATSREIFFLQSLVDVFQEYVKATAVDLSSPEIAPEIEGLWKLLEDGSRQRKTSPRRVYAEAQRSFETSKPPDARPKSCLCNHIAQSVSLAFAQRLFELGFDANRAVDDWVWQATDLEKMLDLFTITEEGLEDPNLSFLNLLFEANRLPRLPVQQSAGVSEESAAKSIVKAVLVGLPMLQNYLAHLDIKNGGHQSIKVNYAKKVKWFLFLNIAWAVWHENMQVGEGELQRVSLQHRQQNVAMGLLVSAFAVVSEFSWDGKLFKEENSEAFNDFNVGLYTVWNYRWVAALFEPRRLQYHFWHGLGLPVLQALGNEKSSAYWVNYRRDGLMTAMMNLAPLPQDESQ
ncbi:RHOMBOID-like protein [Durusdinium trenchii]|uniref:RHOMBOID-like protein n=1 Tax=Durusdinium trenchii TaxID=1381693 RepID=A0ABP0J3R1_9DINO